MKSLFVFMLLFIEWLDLLSLRVSLLLMLFLLSLVLLKSSGVPRPSVFIVSTLLAREKSIPLLREWEDRFEGARPKSWRRRRRWWG